MKRIDGKVKTILIANGFLSFFAQSGNSKRKRSKSSRPKMKEKKNRVLFKMHCGNIWKEKITFNLKYSILKV